MLRREATSYSRCLVDMVHWESTSCSRCSACMKWFPRSCRSRSRLFSSLKAASYSRCLVFWQGSQGLPVVLDVRYALFPRKLPAVPGYLYDIVPKEATSCSRFMIWHSSQASCQLFQMSGMTWFPRSCYRQLFQTFWYDMVPWELPDIPDVRYGCQVFLVIYMTWYPGKLPAVPDF